MVTVEAIAQVRVDGVLHDKGARFDMEQQAALDLEKDGYIDIVESDGKPVVWAACCNEHNPS